MRIIIVYILGLFWLKYNPVGSLICQPSRPTLPVPLRSCTAIIIAGCIVGYKNGL